MLNVWNMHSDECRPWKCLLIKLIIESSLLKGNLPEIHFKWNSSFFSKPDVRVLWEMHFQCLECFWSKFEKKFPNPTVDCGLKVCFFKVSSYKEVYLKKLFGIMYCCWDFLSKYLAWFKVPAVRNPKQIFYMDPLD